jgi:hypothetical protein
MPSRGFAVAQVARYGTVAKKVFPTLWSVPIFADERVFICTIKTYLGIASISNLVHILFRVHTRKSWRRALALTIAAVLKGTTKEKSDKVILSQGQSLEIHHAVGAKGTNVWHRAGAAVVALAISSNNTINT